MLHRIFEQYQMQDVLSPLIDAGAPQTAWWVVDTEGRVLFRTVDRQPVGDGLQWDLSEHGILISAEQYPKVRSLGDAMARLLTMVLQNEMQRMADEALRKGAQQETQVHFRTSLALAALTRREEINQYLVQEALELIRAKGVVLYSRQPNGEFRLDAIAGQTPYGSRPPSLLRKGLLQHAAASGETIWLNTVITHEAATPTERQAQNVLALLIYLREQVYGVIGLFNHPEGFTSQHLHVLRILTHHAAIAYQHAATNLALAAADSDWQEVFEHSDLDWQELKE